jgi:thiol-disulfide isomerase/thioredoxin
MEALHVLLNSRSQVTPEQVARLSDLLLSAAERLPDQSASWPPLSITLAEIYVRHRIRLDRVPEMVQKGLEDIEYQERYRRDADVFANIPDSMRHDNVQFTHDKVREIRARHALATGDRERALALLGDLRRELEASKPEDDRSRAAQQWQRKHSAYLRLAKEAGLDVQPVAELVLSNPEDVKRYPVADFEAKDMSGRTWRLADLKGKVAYVNVWTTWCAPCRAEMPGLQKLHERWKDRPDRVVLTISADFHPMLVESFLKEAKYTFPVLHGTEVAEKFFPPVYFPQNWLIDPQGQRLETPPPRAYETTLGQIEELAAKVAASGVR